MKYKSIVILVPADLSYRHTDVVHSRSNIGGIDEEDTGNHPIITSISSTRHHH